MHCPRCGQQQMSNELKFCSRCGFQLGLVAELIANDGFLPQLAEFYSKKSSGIFTRRNGVAFSLLWCLFFLLIMAPLWAIVDVDELAAASAVIGIFGGFILLVSSLIFLKKPVPSFELNPSSLPFMAPMTIDDKGRPNALPPQRGQPASSYIPPEGAWRAPDTDDLVRPGSVTENTTKLLKKNSDNQ